jgi:hypothetical protein
MAGPGLSDQGYLLAQFGPGDPVFESSGISKVAGLDER